MKSLKLLTLLAGLTLASAGVASAQVNSPSNPNCSPGVQGCTANYATTDHSDQNPTKGAAGAAMSPNCSPGQQGCSANYPTTDHSDQNPLKQGTPAASPSK
jgi:hypothetical protein